MPKRGTAPRPSQLATAALRMASHEGTDMAKVTAEVKFTGEPAPWGDGGDRFANGWKVTLRYQGRRLTVPFWTGSALGEPTAADVLECLASDASSADQSFEDWADDYGFDTDSRKGRGDVPRGAAQHSRAASAHGRRLRDAGLPGDRGQRERRPPLRRMTERYSVHLGARAEEWPAAVAGASTRGEAQRIASAMLAAAPLQPPHKAEVRDRGARLLDCYGRRGGVRIHHVYAAIQRGAETRPDEVTP